MEGLNGGPAVVVESSDHDHVSVLPAEPCASTYVSVLPTLGIDVRGILVCACIFFFGVMKMIRVPQFSLCVDV